MVSTTFLTALKIHLNNTTQNSLDLNSECSWEQRSLFSWFLSSILSVFCSRLNEDRWIRPKPSHPKKFWENRPQDSTLDWEKGDRCEAGGRDSVRGRRRGGTRTYGVTGLFWEVLLGWTEHTLPEGMPSSGERETGTRGMRGSGCQEKDMEWREMQFTRAGESITEMKPMKDLI